VKIGKVVLEEMSKVDFSIYSKYGHIEGGANMAMTVWLLNLQLPVQSVSITTQGEVYSIQPYVIKFVSDLWQVCCFLPILKFLRQYN
jgi:hypothetical protein